MNKINSLIAIIALAFALPAFSAEKVAEKEKPSLAVGLEPYGTINWRGVNGEADLGAGLGATLGITKNLSITAFAEGDSTQDPNFFDQIDRAGAGLRYTIPLGTRVTLDAGAAGAYDIHNENFFLRLPLGASLYVIKEKSFSAGVRIQYAFDISGNGKNGTANAIGSAGPFLTLSF